MFKKGNKGITLIALVITIIVLLILAGVTIAQITGQDSAPQKAVEARQKNEQGAEFDAIKLAAINAIAEGNLDLYVDIPTLKAGLQGLVTDDLDTVIDSSLTEWTVTGNSGVKYKITNRGNVTLASTVDIERNGEIVTGETLTFAVSAVGSTEQLTARPTSDLTLNSATWGSSNTSVATVSNSGLIEIVGGGETTITLTAVTAGGNFTKKCTIKVAQAVSSMTLSTNAALSVRTGKTGTITVSSITPSTNVEDIVFEIDTANAAGAYFGTSENPTTSTTVPVSSGSASATINIPSNATVGNTSTVTIKGASSGAGSVSCTVTVESGPVEADTQTSYVGYYAYVDGVYGVIYADLLAQDTRSGKWGDSNGAWSLPDASAANAYKSYEVRALTDSDSKFGNGNTGVITQVNGTTGLDRFYIMEISNRGSGVNWATACSTTAGTNNSWRLPSKIEWSIFGSAFGITSSNYSSTYGLSGSYWSSTEYNSSTAWRAGFFYGNMYYDNTNTNARYVCLCTTF